MEEKNVDLVFLPIDNPAGIYLLKVCNMFKAKRGHWCRSGVFIIDFDHVIGSWKGSSLSS